MAFSDLRFFKRCAEFIERNEIKLIPAQTRGIYCLHKQRKGGFDTIYVGMSRGLKAGVQGRIRQHTRNKKKGLWTHFSVFEVMDNITTAEIEELEGLVRHVYRKDKLSNPLNYQRSYKKLTKLRKRHKFEAWKDGNI